MSTNNKKQQNGNPPPIKEVSEESSALDPISTSIVVPSQVSMLLEAQPELSNKQAMKERTIAATDGPKMLKAVAWRVKGDEKEAKRFKRFTKSAMFSHVKHLLLICSSADDPEALEFVESHLARIRRRHQESIETCAYYDHELESACIDVYDSYQTDSFNTMFALLDLLVWRRNPRRDEGLKWWKDVKEGEEVEITTYSKQVKPFVECPLQSQSAGFFRVHVHAATDTLQNYSLYAQLLKYLGTRGRDTAVQAEKKSNRDLFLCYEDVRLTIAYPEEGQETLDELATFLPLIYGKVPEAFCVNLRILTGHDTFLPEEDAIYQILQGCQEKCKTAIAAVCTSSRPPVHQLIDLKYYQQRKQDGQRGKICASMCSNDIMRQVHIQVKSTIAGKTGSRCRRGDKRGGETIGE